MTEYEKTKWHLVNKTVELADDIQHIEECCDKVQKVNMYLIGKYYDELCKEFNIEGEKCIMRIMKLYDAIADKMKEKMPEPWYAYGINSGVEAPQNEQAEN